MSISTRISNSQNLVTNIQSSLADFNIGLQKSNKPISLSLSSQEIALFLAHTSLEKNSIIAILDKPKKELRSITDQIHSWQEILQENSHKKPIWHIISHQLSEQEQDGTISTKLTEAYHYLLQKTPGHNFMIHAEQIDQPSPNRSAYWDAAISFSVGDTVKRQNLLDTFVSNGFIRSNQAIEPGTFRIRGESLDVWHTAWTEPVNILLHGSSIEQIVRRQKRPESINSIRIPSLSLPEKNTKLQEIIQQQDNTIIVSPAYLGSDIKTDLIYDALSTDIEFPFTYTDNFVEEETNQTVSKEKALELLAKLTIGKPVVHSDHGVGIYEGLQTRTINEITHDYLIVRYKNGDTLSVPVELAHKVTAYVGDSVPKLHSLGGTSWKSTRKAARRDAERMAKQLIAIARERAKNTRPVYNISEEMLEQIDQKTPFDLTEDQTRTWQEIIVAMQKDHPMDRLLVGDVGFGKTEMAIRATEIAIANNRQVAILAPTTLLVQQHFDTFKTRLPHVVNKIGLLSRFTTKTEQKNTRQKIESGEIQVVVGTHALLSKSTKWHNLGLVIIDEEQRFGVSHKEHFKEIRASADVLSLSATPIPRSLFMSLSGVRDLSVITTAPTGRKTIETKISKDSDEMLRTAIRQERDREGQIYVVAPHVRGLNALAHRISKLDPSASVAVAHGQMDERQLAKTMHSFDAGETNILVSSSIISNGIDLPNANTIIVTKATHFGLSTLYQLRGRVGRRKKQGYAYFLYSQDKITTIQRQRLAALTEATRLGSGWDLARRDLEIRGAGNLLGAEQSGHIEAVGLQFYLDLINEATDESLRDHELHRDQVEVQLPLTSLIPVDFISDVEERTRWYHRLTRATSIERLQEQSENLKKSYNFIPQETKNLIRTLKLQHLAANNNISRISYRKISPSDRDPFHRLEVSSKNIPETLKKLAMLGNLEVQEEIIVHNTKQISPDYVDTIIKALS